MSISRIKSTRNWIELASQSPTSGATLNITGLAAYDRYRIVCTALTNTGFDIRLRINNDTGNNYYQEGYAVSTYIDLQPTSVNCDLVIESANDAVYKSITGWSARNLAAAGGPEYIIYASNDTITEFNFFNSSTGTFSSGNVKIYGAND